MTYLVHDEFNDLEPIETKLRVPHKGVYLDFLRTHCFKSGTVAGTFTCTISQDGNDLATATITADQINAISGTYAHGFFRWDFPNKVRLNTNPEDEYAEYDLRFESSGYTRDSNNFFDICKDFDNQLVPEFGVHFNDTTNEQKAVTMPYGFEMYEIK